MTEERREQIQYFGLAALAGTILLLNLTGVWTTFLGINTGALVAILGGYRIFYNSISALLEKEISADLAICIAVIAALIVGEYLAAGEAMFIMMIGEGIEGFAAAKTGKAIERFVEQMPRRARRLRSDGSEEDVDAGSLGIDDLIRVLPGERLPADGVIVKGSSSLDESTITGEPLPADKGPRDLVYAGTLNGNSLLDIKVTQAGSDTTLARVAQLVEEAKENQAPVVRLADHYAKYFLPLLLLAGLGTWYFTRDWSRTVAVLICACPCALILATPCAMVAAIGGLARRGILVRGGTVLQQAAQCDTVLWDKTGTITEGRFQVVKLLPVNGFDDVLLRLAASVESGSPHPLAKVIVDEARRRDVTPFVVADTLVTPGRGVEAKLRGDLLRAGNATMMAEAGIGGYEPMLDEADRLGATAVLVSEGSNLVGAILLRDRLREGAREAVAEFGELELDRQIMLTGDRRRAAEVIAREAGVPELEAELLPEHKLDRVRALGSQGRKVLMIGEGVNDAPALAAAHVGVAVHGASDISAEAADVVYLGQSLDKLPKLVEVSRSAMRNAWQNIFVFALAFNIIAVWLCATGVLSPIGGALTHQLSSFFVMMNALRLLRIEDGPSILDRLKALPRPRFLDRLQLPEFSRTFDWRTWITAGVTATLGYLRTNWRTVAQAAVVLLLLNGFYTIQPDEVGVIERFGRKVLPADEPGLHYKLPWPIDKLQRVPAKRIRTVEIGFRSGASKGDAEPVSYEWNVQHRSGRFERRVEEAQVLSGDQNMLEMNATVHYRIARADEFLFNHADAEQTIRAAAEAALQAVVTVTPLDELLTNGRRQVEARAKEEMTRRLALYKTGAEVLDVKLLDVHPTEFVVGAFREVSAAFEEKNRLINEAEGYRNEQVAKARGEGEARRETAIGYSAGRRNRAEGDSSRFIQWESSYRLAPGPNDTRLYLETMEQVLPGRKKVIVDAGKGKRHIMYLEDGIEIAPPGLPMIAPRRGGEEEER